ncbi:hypothetical protein BC829DRAFT_441803 [Chytridium lagenaria]|nr:hypothetical protein BC829DRAFT_441803 [Chytridium lagenaria]
MSEKLPTLVAGSFDPEWAVNANLRGIEEPIVFVQEAFLSIVEAFRDAITRYDLKTKIEEEFTLELRHGSILVLGYLLGICTIDPSPRPPETGRYGVLVPEANVNAMELVDDVVRGRKLQEFAINALWHIGSPALRRGIANFMFTLPSLRGNHIKVNFTVGDWAVCATAFGYASSRLDEYLDVASIVPRPRLLSTGPSSIGWASFSSIKTVVLLDQRLGKASFTDLPLEVILRILCVPQGKPRFGQVRPINRLRMLNYLSATCRRLRSSLWESPHAVARVILTQNGMDVMKAINFFLKLIKGNSITWPCKGHPLGSSFEKDLKLTQALLDMGADVNHEVLAISHWYALAGVRSVDDPGLISLGCFCHVVSTSIIQAPLKAFGELPNITCVEVMFLLEHSGIDVDVAILLLRGSYSLIKACRYNHVEMARLLIDHGADVNYGPGLPLPMQLATAIQYHRLTGADLLPSYVALKWGRTDALGLMAACELGKIEIVEILLDEGLGRVDLATKLAQGSLNDVVDS